MAVNVLLFLAVVLATWFATQQAADDHRAGENAAALAKNTMTFELEVAASRRYTREQAGSSVNPAPARTDVPAQPPSRILGELLVLFLLGLTGVSGGIYASAEVTAATALGF